MTDLFDTHAEHFSLFVRAMALLCVRNTKLEDIHAGKSPITHTGDYSDVNVVDADGRHLPWTDVSRIDDNEMRDLMRQVVNLLYTFCHHAQDPAFLDQIEIYMRTVRQWDEPRIQDGFLQGTPTRH